MSTFSIGIRTVPRAENYLTGTLARLVESGTLSHPSLLGFHVSARADLTPNENALSALLPAIQDGPDWVVLLEDDVDVIDDLLPSLDRWLTGHARRDVHFYPLGSFEHSAIASKIANGESVWPVALSGYYGSQAVAFRRDDAIAFLEWYPTRLPLLAASGWTYPRDRCLDLHLAAWHRVIEPGQHCVLTPAPCFINHVGEVSSIAPDKDRGYTGPMRGFGGRDYSYRSINQADRQETAHG